MGDPYFLGVDLGGTQMRMAAVSRAGELASDVHAAPTGTGFSPDDLRRELRALGDRIAQGMDGHRLAALGFGTAGVVGDGPLTQSPNLPLIEGNDVSRLVAEAMGCRVTVENDARC